VVCGPLSIKYEVGMVPSKRRKQFTQRSSQNQEDQNPQLLICKNS